MYLPRIQDMLPVYEETTGLYGIKRESIEKYRCRIGRKPYLYLVNKFEAVDINTEEDLKVAEYIDRLIYNLGDMKALRNNNIITQKKNY